MEALGGGAVSYERGTPVLHRVGREAVVKQRLDGWECVVAILNASIYFGRAS